MLFISVACYNEFNQTYGLSKARELAQDDMEAQDEAKIYIPRQLVIYMEEHREIKDKLTLTIDFH